jgi:hypothetical protein
LVARSECMNGGKMDSQDVPQSRRIDTVVGDAKGVKLWQNEELSPWLHCSKGNMESMKPWEDDRTIYPDKSLYTTSEILKIWQLRKGLDHRCGEQYILEGGEMTPDQ